jgi:hypothetical protein
MAMNAVIGLALAAMALSAPTPLKSGSLPLRRGVYVDVGAGCAGAASSAKSWFGGGYVIQASHAQCKLKAVIRSDRTHYLVTLRCNENGDPTMPFVVVDHVRLVSHTEYEMTNRFGRFRSRWCRN